ncbi:MAG: NADP-dependent isocitrate dehydrogenase [Gloeomargarita sp. SKYBB_i_bin120]|nr:NADP-dependent isocitrate dehydrogenase [Gloeomargarita sp. SKYG98]MCS7292929.1 NADP-dependent isocitrate dehydrogenase [Gloeomargarita sp. SKYB120]MDW8178494.1 NADP-dependent isocitrate dehydrogenase [Gloeomargarita sp. SKYBB_i_bin120]
MYEKITPPPEGERITFVQGLPQVPDQPIIPYIRGDGIGVDIWPATRLVLDEAVRLSYGGTRKIHWFKVYAGDEACAVYGELQYLPQDTLTAIREYGVAIKGPLTTPVGGGIRSLNVALRQIFDLYACIRPCRYYPGTPSPHRHPELIDLIIYRENTEDIYLGIEWPAESQMARQLIQLLNEQFIPNTPEHQGKRIPLESGIGIKPISKTGSQRLIRRAIQHALRLPPGKQTVTLVHKGNIMKYTEGAFRDWGYELVQTEFRQQCVTERESWILENVEKNPGLSVAENARLIEPGFDHLPSAKQAALCAEVQRVLDTIGESHGQGRWRHKVMVNDRIADNIFQQIQTRPQEYSILATMNLNGDYLSDAAAAMVGGLGMGPGANLGDTCAIFEATHGTAPKYAGQDRVNPSSLILSGAMLLEFLGWQEAADLIHQALGRAIAQRQVTYDLARLMEPPVDPPLSCSGFAQAVVQHMVDLKKS